MNHRKIKILVTLAAFCILWTNTLHSADGQLPIVGDPLPPLRPQQHDPELVRMEFIKAHEYNNTFWKRLWNTYLRVVSRKALVIGLPYSAYRVETFKENLCTYDNLHNTKPLGTAIGFVGQFPDHADRSSIYNGIKLKRSAKPNATPAIQDVCAWLTDDSLPKFYDFFSIYSRLTDANPPPNGTWRKMDPSTVLPDDARLAFKAHLGASDASKSGTSWEWLVGKSTLSDSVRESVSEFWSYDIEGNPSGFYLTTTAANQANKNLPAPPLITTFDWVLPSMPNLKTGEIPVLWIKSTSETVPENLFLMTDTGLPSLVADIHLDKALSTD